MNEDQWAAIFDTNVAGTLRGCQVFYQALCASGSGRIIIIESLGAFVAFHQESRLLCFQGRRVIVNQESRV